MLGTDKAIGKAYVWFARLIDGQAIGGVDDFGKYFTTLLDLFARIRTAPRLPRY